MDGREWVLGVRERGGVVISVKFGVLRAPDGAIFGLDGRPAAVKNSLANSLTHLGTDYVDIYRLVRYDTRQMAILDSERGRDAAQSSRSR
jgi:aryl-alcohol dehydrogenase-like predicted oxidoreductase